MSNVLFINIPAEGHVNPTVGLVKELVERGENVTYFCTKTFEDRLNKAGATVRTYEDFLNTFDNPHQNPSQFFKHLLENQATLVDTILTDVENESYDYVIFDSMCMTGGIVADVLNVPKICSHSTFALNKEMMKLMSKQTSIDIDFDEEFMGIIRNLEKTHHLDLKHIRDFSGFMTYPSNLTIVHTSKEYQINADQFDQSYKFVGPSIVERKDESEFPFEELANRDVIFISMGTVFNDQLDFYYTCFKAFENVNAKIVLSVGRKINIEDLKGIPENFIVRNYVPQLKVLEYTNVFFTHGGMNSSSEGLYFSTPLAVLPISADQPIIAKRVVELGAGVELDINNVTPDELRDTAKLLLTNPSYKKQAEHISKSFKDAGGHKKAVDEIFASIRLTLSK